MRDSIKQSVKEFIDEHPIWLIYARLDRRFPHLDCWSPEANSPSRKCPLCLGTGYNLTLEKHPTRRVIRASETGPFSSGPGYFDNFLVTIYTDARYIPYRRD